MKLLLTLVFLAAAARADEITWVARGAVTSVVGNGFAASGVAAGDVVALEMSYDSGATVRKPRNRG